MKTYELSEFTFLLKLGLWTGGKILDFGYLSEAEMISTNNNIAGILGIEFSNTVVLEKYELKGINVINLIFSIYKPLQGMYQLWRMNMDYIGDFENVLLAIVQNEEIVKMRSINRCSTKMS